MSSTTNTTSTSGTSGTSGTEDPVQVRELEGAGSAGLGQVVVRGEHLPGAGGGDLMVLALVNIFAALVWAVVAVAIAAPSAFPTRDGYGRYQVMWRRYQRRTARRSGKDELRQGLTGAVPDGQCRLAGGGSRDGADVLYGHARPALWADPLAACRPVQRRRAGRAYRVFWSGQGADGQLGGALGGVAGAAEHDRGNSGRGGGDRDGAGLGAAPAAGDGPRPDRAAARAGSPAHRPRARQEAISGGHAGHEADPTSEQA